MIACRPSPLPVLITLGMPEAVTGCGSTVDWFSSRLSDAFVNPHAEVGDVARATFRHCLDHVILVALGDCNCEDESALPDLLRVAMTHLSF
jgi:hypothetical protein